MRRLVRWARNRMEAKAEAGERGAVLVLVAASLVVFMGMAAFAVDYGWLFFSQLNTRKAAEAAALAGVVHMPLPNCGVPNTGTQPHTSALDVASRNGYSSSSGATVTPAMGNTCAQLEVTITNTIPTFFMSVFGIDTLTITESATAEQLPALKLGSDEPYLGEDPTVSGRNRNFFLAISGEDRTKGQGDAVAAQRRNNGNSNPEYDVPSYYYAFEIPESSSLIGTTVYVQVFDPQAYDQGSVGGTGPGLTNDWVLRDPGSGVDDHGWDSKTRFRVYRPDATPNQWTDNSVQVSGCNDTFRGASDRYRRAHSSFNFAWVDTWVNVCTISNATSGIYVIEVSSDYGSNDGTDMINGFSIRGSRNGGTGSSGAVTSTNDLQVYGLGTMSLWQFDTGSNPVFKIARLDDIYAGSSLIISLWDVSDIGSAASIEFVGATSQTGSPIDCDVRNVSDGVNVLAGGGSGSWGSDSNGGDGTTCKLNFSSGQYNNRWLQFRFDIPPSYTCGPGSGSSPSSPGCWIFVSYDVSGSITDRTTWAAAIDGQPIHLIP